eukprot:Plantae.Rhodophyta-Palmaria_palmata.ctg2342.p1 GENE.Plantae.Rhodophyta-Palmaria_palmata.ctg2342~~Plantae.Rhodophyta-Palmaria_palmata.ctg2342.p1  ORF type:complete len:330 (+),score=87.18 Plantae.Rhodophyta-Palmaria_palmata.ctg2342:83-1072(+)
MKRSSSKLITRARSMRNVAKTPFKFKFDILVETVDKLAASGDIVVVWERGQKVDGTKPAKIDKTTRKANFSNEKISSDVVLHKASPTDKKFQDKVIKIAIRSGNVEGKTLGKIHLNLADYAEVPSGSKRIGAEMSNGATLVATIQCTFQSMGKVTSKGDKKGDDALAADDDEEENEEEAPPDEDSPSSLMKLKFSANMKRASSKKMIGRKSQAPSASTNEDATSASVGGGGANDCDRLRKENARLKKQMEENERNGGGGGDAKTDEENKALKREVKDLRCALAREPVYADVVKELKEAKMALALLNLEKEEVHLELQKLQRASSPMSSP